MRKGIELGVVLDPEVPHYEIPVDPANTLMNAKIKQKFKRFAENNGMDAKFKTIGNTLHVFVEMPTGEMKKRMKQADEFLDVLVRDGMNTEYYKKYGRQMFRLIRNRFNERGMDKEYTISGSVDNKYVGVRIMGCKGTTDKKGANAISKFIIDQQNRIARFKNDNDYLSIRDYVKNFGSAKVSKSVMDKLGMDTMKCVLEDELQQEVVVLQAEQPKYYEPTYLVMLRRY